MKLTSKWEVIYEDEIWTVDGDLYIATVFNDDYPDNSSIAEYICKLHNEKHSILEENDGV